MSPTATARNAAREQRIEVRKTHKLYIGGAFPRSESGRTYEVAYSRGKFLANVAMGSTLPIMRVVIPMCPLLGLLGTVTGMLEVFDVMTLSGSADTRTMAGGVSHAMVSTMSGLAVSLSGMFFVNRFQSRVERETQRLNDVLSYEE